MVREGKRSITVDEGTFEELERRKDDDDTWDDFLIRGAEIVNPVPHIDRSQLPLEDHEWLELKFSRFRDDIEMYLHPDAGYFILPPEEQEIRETMRVLEERGFQRRYLNRRGETEEWKLERDRVYSNNQSVVIT